MISGFRHEVDEICTVLGITEYILVVPYQCFGTTYRFHLQGSRNLLGFLDLEDSCPKTLVRNCHYMLCNILEECRSQFTPNFNPHTIFKETIMKQNTGIFCYSTVVLHSGFSEIIRGSN